MKPTVIHLPEAEEIAAAEREQATYERKWQAEYNDSGPEGKARMDRTLTFARANSPAGRMRDRKRWGGHIDWATGQQRND